MRSIGARAANRFAQQAETLARFRALVQIDSSGPAGNETKVVEYLKGVFAEAGILTQVFARDAARANLVARIPGNGKKRPLLLLAHTDVAAVQREKWPVDPFGAIEKDGYVWGRGTTDDKDKLAANLMLMLLLKRSHATLDRDIIGTSGHGSIPRLDNAAHLSAAVAKGHMEFDGPAPSDAGQMNNGEPESRRRCDSCDGRRLRSRESTN